MRTSIPVLAALALGCAVPLPAQSLNSFAAYAALITTPPAALPPVLSSAMLGRPMTSPNVAIRYGRLSGESVGINAIDARLALPTGARAAYGFGVGYQKPNCSDAGCDGHVMAGAFAEGRLTHIDLGTSEDAGRLNIGLNGELGFGKRSEVTVWSFTAGLPIALVAGGPTMKVAPFLTPGFGWGRFSADGDSENGTRFLFGGGVTVQSLTSGVGVTAGFQKVFIDGSRTLFGLALVLGAR